MVTEEVVPLVNFLQVDEGQNESIIAWGIHQIAVSVIKEPLTVFF